MENINESTNSIQLLHSEQPLLTHSSVSIFVDDRQNTKECQSTINDDDVVVVVAAQSPKKRKQMQRSVTTVTSSHRPINCDEITDKQAANNTNKRLKIMDKSTHHNLVLNNNEQKIVTKPPLPPTLKQQKMHKKLPKKLPANSSDGDKNGIDRKIITNNNSSTILVQKLTNQTEQLRLEISELKQALATEKDAVRELRVQSDVEHRKQKAEAKRKQIAFLESTKKIAKRKLGNNNNADGTITNTKEISIEPLTTNCNSLGTTSSAVAHKDTIAKLNQEILHLKCVNKSLEEKISISSQSERRKVADIRELKDSYEARLTQISKSAKIEIHRLLEEIKAKEKQIEQLKREAVTHSTNQHNNKSSSSKKDNCKSTEKVSPPVIVATQIAVHHSMHKEKEIEGSNCSTNSKDNNIFNISNFGNKLVSLDTSGSDNDSAFSLSSEPPSISPQPGTFHNSTDVWQTFAKESSRELENLQKDYESVQEENQFLNCELTSAKEQITELEKLLRYTHENNDELTKRILLLKQNENCLFNESHELRQQNELLEFRIIELEECHEKWSTNSGTIPDTQDVCTNTDDELSRFSIFEPNCASQMDAQNDIFRNRLQAIIERTDNNDEDKPCLVHALSLLNNAKVQYMDQNTIHNDYCEKSTSCNPNKHSVNTKTKSPERIVATVQPYSSAARQSSIVTIDVPLIKQCSSIRMDESGIFDSDCSLTDTSFLASIEHCSQSTQTDSIDNEFSIVSQTTNATTADVSTDLCAEIQKLNKFRKIVEERATQNVKILSNSVPSTVDTQRLDYYKDRLQLLENKLLVYESSGDVQTKRLAKRLQRELQLEALVKDLTQRVEKFTEKNRQLEEEKCEFEEAENDARLLLQRLEIDLEMLKQRNIELEISRDTSKSHASCLQDTINDAQDKIYLLEEEKEELRHKIDMLTMFMPAIALFYSWQNRTLCDRGREQNDKLSIAGNTQMNTDAREQELLQNIAELNRAYNETLESADNLWAQMEKEYKEKLTEADDDKLLLQSKMRMLEERMRIDAQCAHERIVQLEESENILKQNLMKLSRDLKNDVINFEQLSIEFSAVQEQCAKLNEYLQGPAAEMLEKERRKVQNLITELKVAKRTHADLKEAHKKQMHILRGQISKINKNLMHTSVSNGELKEEVITLENRLIELNLQHESDLETIKNLSIELQSKHAEVSRIVQKMDYGRNLAEELESATEHKM